MSSSPTSAMEVPTIIAYPSFSSSCSASASFSSSSQKHHQHHNNESFQLSDSVMEDLDGSVSVSSLSYTNNHHHYNNLHSSPPQESSFQLPDSSWGGGHPHYPPTMTPNHGVTTLSPSATAATRQTPSYHLPPSSSLGHTHTTNSNSNNDNTVVRVNVGGESFAFPQSAFSVFAALPWNYEEEATENGVAVFSLPHSSPAVFEVLLDYILFGTLPAYDTLCQEEFEEFETMALAMGGGGGMNDPHIPNTTTTNQAAVSWTPLLEHLDRKDSYRNRELRRRQQQPQAGGGRGASSSSPRAATPQPILLNPDDNAANKSLNTIRATQCARWFGALCGVADAVLPRRRRRRRRPHKNGDAAVKRLKLTLPNGQWCVQQQQPQHRHMDRNRVS